MTTEQRIAYMVNLHQGDTGIDTVIWVDHKWPNHEPFIMALTSLGKVSISIEDEPKVLEPDNLFDGDDISAVIKWICLNKDVLLDYWNNNLYPTSKMLKELRRV